MLLWSIYVSSGDRYVCTIEFIFLEFFLLAFSRRLLELVRRCVIGFECLRLVCARGFARVAYSKQRVIAAFFFAYKNIFYQGWLKGVLLKPSLTKIFTPYFF